MLHATSRQGCDVIHQILSLPRFFPFIQLLNLLVCFLAVLLVLFWFKTHIPFVICRLHFVQRVDWYNFHRHQSVGLSSLESWNKWAKPQVLSRRYGLKILKSTYTELVKYVLELFKAPCLLFEVQWPLGHFLLFMPYTSLRQFPLQVGITLVPRTAMLEWGEVSARKIFLLGNLPLLIWRSDFWCIQCQCRCVGKVLTREKHSEPHAGLWLRPPAHAVSHKVWGPSLARKWHSSTSRDD